MDIEKRGIGRLDGSGESRLKFGPNFLLTTGMEFGKFGAGVGNLETDGFSARISNHSSGQDALAISANKKTFVVADGLGGAGSFNPAAVTKWSRLVAEAVARLPDIKTILIDEGYLKLTAPLKEKLEKEGMNLKSALSGKIVGIRTTLSAVQRTGKNTFAIVTIGDSPIYVIHKHTGKIIKQYGEDAMTGKTDGAMENYIGMTDKGEIKPLNPENKKYIVSENITVNPGELLVIGTDFFSDHTYAGRSLNEYIGLDSKEFHSKVSSKDAAKGDDATLIIIDPEKLQ